MLTIARTIPAALICMVQPSPTSICTAVEIPYKSDLITFEAPISKGQEFEMGEMSTPSLDGVTFLGSCELAVGTWTILEAGLRPAPEPAQEADRFIKALTTRLHLKHGNPSNKSEYSADTVSLSGAEQAVLITYQTSIKYSGAPMPVLCITLVRQFNDRQIIFNLIGVAESNPIQNLPQLKSTAIAIAQSIRMTSKRH
ncbi:hypothetical protein [Geothrix oryzae]|uniref:hypothetical protein n=1 Tax=Geothrix oryzae TaxID=2927975 RepID=UPI00257299C0|nr:hypothetical protein [Geothrix oryzae]